MNSSNLSNTSRKSQISATSTPKPNKKRCNSLSNMNQLVQNSIQEVTQQQSNFNFAEISDNNQNYGKSMMSGYNDTEYMVSSPLPGRHQANTNPTTTNNIATATNNSNNANNKNNLASHSTARKTTAKQLFQNSDNVDFMNPTTHILTSKINHMKISEEPSNISESQSQNSKPSHTHQFSDVFYSQEEISRQQNNKQHSQSRASRNSRNSRNSNNACSNQKNQTQNSCSHMKNSRQSFTNSEISKEGIVSTGHPTMSSTNYSNSTHAQGNSMNINPKNIDNSLESSGNENSHQGLLKEKNKLGSSNDINKKRGRKSIITGFMGKISGSVKVRRK